MEKYQDFLKGRGAQINPPNPYFKQEYDTEVDDGLDEPMVPNPKTEIFYDQAKKILNKVSSPDIPLDWSINPYQGCEHGCIYCYARNAHHYWGFSAGLDFERKIIVKKNAAELLRETFNKKNWKPAPVMFSGNTDCYQPLERKLKLTRACLEVFRDFQHPVSLITKNSLILRDLDILKDLAAKNLVHVYITITTLNKKLRSLMEPRTASASRRLEVIRQLSEHNVPVGAMLGPVIPGLNNHEIPQLMESVARMGALSVGYTFVRLTGAIGPIFEDWIQRHYPDRAEKVLNQIREAHGGKLSNNQFGTRMRGKGEMAESISRLFKLARRKYIDGREMPPYDLTVFKRPGDGQLSLF